MSLKPPCEYEQCTADHPGYPLVTYEDYKTLMIRFDKGEPAAVARIKFYQAVAKGMLQGYGQVVPPPMGTVATFSNPPARAEKVLYPAPPGVHYARSTRVGDVERDKYISRLGLAMADGYVSLDEFQARADAAAKALTKTELDSLIQDLPALPVKEKKEEKKKEQLPLPLLVLMLATAGIVFPYSVISVMITLIFILGFSLMWISLSMLKKRG